MLKEHSSFIKQAIATIDLLLLLLAFYVSHELVSEFRPLSPLLTYWPMLVGFSAFYLYFAWTRHLFSILQFNWMRALASRVAMIFISAGVLGAAILYMTPDSYSSRTFYITFAGLSFLFIATEKLLLKEIFARLRRSDRNTTPVILFGRGRMAAQLLQEIGSHLEWGLRVVRKLDLSISPGQFEEVLKTSYVEEVFFCIPRTISREGFRIDPYLRVCEEMGRPARVFLNLSSATHFARWEHHRFMDRATLVSHTVELDPDQMIFKRAFDIAGSLAGLLILFAIYPFLALAIKLSSRGPVFFKQVRVGRNGKRFVIYKFRSMYLDAEERKKELEEKNELKGAVFKLKDDPRVTPAGKIIRRFSLDELPQFINVLKGEMSLVGTRPPTPDEVSMYQKWHHRRISTKPGITGMWQVSGRNKITDFDEIVKLDLKYIDSWSIWLDITIILKTLLVFFRKDEAY
jgi:exopolysaccharide biosynthesis polyprenyl glycosylphosphotransferase